MHLPKCIGQWSGYSRSRHVSQHTMTTPSLLDGIYRAAALRYVLICLCCFKCEQVSRLSKEVTAWRPLIRLPFSLKFS